MRQKEENNISYRIRLMGKKGLIQRELQEVQMHLLLCKWANSKIINTMISYNNKLKYCKEAINLVQEQAIQV
jgi:hypothetical protein